MERLKEKILVTAQANNADIIGFGNVERFSKEDIQKIYPATATVIGLAFRVLRGSYRGIEEGSTFYQYTTTGVEALEETIMPLCALRICALLEDNGYTAVPYRRMQTVMEEADGINPEVDYEEIYHNKYTEHAWDFVDAAVKCGLGERGTSGALLTRSFGPFQRICFVLTDARLSPSPILPPSGFCNQCDACKKACPGGAIKNNGIDNWQCAAYYKGANIASNPFMPPDAFRDYPNREALLTGQLNLTPEQSKDVTSQLFFYPPIKHAYVSSICGRACDRACYDSLERRNMLDKTFHMSFRRRSVWHLPWEDDRSTEK